MTSPRPAPITVSTPELPRDLLISVAALANYGMIKFNGNQPLYDDAYVDGDGEIHAIEVEFMPTHVCQRIIDRAPDLELAKGTDGYTCVLKAGQTPGRGATLVEAVFRAFAEAKASARRPQPTPA